MDIIVVTQFYIKFEIFLQTGFRQIARTSYDRAIAVGMVFLFAEDINLGMDVLFGMDAHFNAMRHDVLNELVHSILYFFIIASILDVLFYLFEELFLRLFRVGIEEQTLLVRLVRQFIHINADKKPDLGRLLNKFANPKVSGGTEIAYKRIKKMHFFVFENTLNLVQ